MAVAASLLAAGPAGALKVRYVATNNAASPNAVTTVDAQCPDGFKVTGGGAFSGGAYDETKIQDTFPVDGKDANTKNDDAWRATMWNTSSQFRNFESQAICAKAKTKTVTAILPNGNGGKRATCPRGWSASGGGVNVNEDFTFYYELVESIPRDGNDAGERAESWFTFILGPGMAATGATTYAVCMRDDEAKIKTRLAFFDSPQDTQASGTSFCKETQKLVGLGGAATTQQAALTTIFGADSPDDANLKLDDGATVTVDNYGSETVNPEVYAVCAK